MSGEGAGIVGATLDGPTGTFGDARLVAKADRATWIEIDPERRIAYAASNVGTAGESEGEILAFAIDPATRSLEPVSRVRSGGAGPTHLAFDRALGALFVAHFGSGQVSVLPVDAAGGLSPPSSVRANTGSGPHRRQAGPHAHGVFVDPSRAFVLVPDFGADRLFVYRFDQDRGVLDPACPAFVQLPPGSGPRHLAFSADGRFVFLLNELTAGIVTYRWDADTGRLAELAVTPLDNEPREGSRSAAAIILSSSGRHLYVSNRGTHAMQAYRVDPRTGALTHIQTISSGGTAPWAAIVTPDGRWMLVANQGTDRVNLFAVDPATGLLRMTASQLAVSRPVALAVLP